MPSISTRPAVFLDRDGVLIRTNVRNGKPYAVTTMEEVSVLPGVIEACAALRQAGYALVMFTNQPEVARGTLSPQELARMNDHVAATLHLDGVQCCPHDDKDNCACRKPKPGMLHTASQQLGLELTSSVTVGDRWRDVAAGRAAGCRTVFIDCEYDEPTPQADCRVRSLSEAVPWIVGKNTHHNPKPRSSTP